MVERSETTGPRRFNSVAAQRDASARTRIIQATEREVSILKQSLASLQDADHEYLLPGVSRTQPPANFWDAFGVKRPSSSGTFGGFAELRRTLYTAHLNLARTAWEEGQTGDVLKLLDLEKAASPDLCGFEWHYWRRRCTMGGMASRQRRCGSSARPGARAW